MKKILALLMSLILVFTLAACGGKAKTDITDSLELLNTVWNGYSEADKFPAAGGDAENTIMDAPGAFGVADTEALDATLGFPAASASKIDGAASLVHMMNLNTFTSGAYHVVNSADTEGLVTEIKDNIMKRQWMCGFPEKLVIVTVDDLYIVSAFGNTELVDNFVSYISTAYPQAKTVVNEPIVV